MLFKSRYSQCQSCGMPLSKDPNGKGGGTEKDGSISTMYCSYCYQNGAFTGLDCTVTQMQDIVEKAMKEQKYGWLIRKLARLQLPHLIRWEKK